MGACPSNLSGLRKSRDERGRCDISYRKLQSTLKEKQSEKPKETHCMNVTLLITSFVAVG